MCWCWCQIETASVSVCTTPLICGQRCDHQVSNRTISRRWQSDQSDRQSDQSNPHLWGGEECRPPGVGHSKPKFLSNSNMNANLMKIFIPSKSGSFPWFSPRRLPRPPSSFKSHRLICKTFNIMQNTFSVKTLTHTINAKLNTSKLFIWKFVFTDELNSVAIMWEAFYKLPKVLSSQEFADRLMLFF